MILKRLFLAIMFGLQLLFLSACGGYIPPDVPRYSDIFTGNQAWIESSYDLFFHHSPEYLNYEYAHGCHYGRLRADDKEMPFMVVTDVTASLGFISPPEDGEAGSTTRASDILFIGSYIASGEDFYEIRVCDSKIPDIIPDDTVLHFDISDIEVEDLYIPEFLGDRRQGDG